MCLLRQACCKDGILGQGILSGGMGNGYLAEEWAEIMKRSGLNNTIQIEIPSQVAWILERLREGGYEAFAVGGCVRDAVLGRVPEDWDITTSAKPDQVKGIFGKTIDTGLQHGTVTVLKDHVGYEITTYRIDGEYEDGRHPKEVAFTSDLKQDLRRRDFTINAMAYSPETGLVDIFGGISDIEKQIIRCVGDPIERFTEDALRILRAIRFSAQLGFTIEEKTYCALEKIAPNLAHVSKERIQAELTKILLSSHPEQIATVEETGMSPYISRTFPAVFSGIGEWKKKLSAASGLPQDKALRWSALFQKLKEKEAGLILRELKMDNDTIYRVKTLVSWLRQPVPEKEPELRQIMSQMDDELFDSLLKLKEVLIPEEKEGIHTVRRLAEIIRRRGDCIRLKELAVSGKELIQAGMKPGPEIGEMLQALFSLVLEQPELNQKEYLLEQIKI